MSDKDPNFINKETLGILEEIREKKEDGSLDQDTKDAVEALDMTSQLMDAVMAGRQLDISFFSIFAHSSIRRLKKKKKKKKKN